MIKKSIDKYEDLVFFNKVHGMSKREFISLFKVKKKSYLYDLYSRLYDAIIGGSINLNKEYNKYYRIEFDNFSDFLISRYNMTEEMLKKYCNKKSYYKEFDRMLEQPIHSLLQDETIKEIIYKFMGGYIYGY